MKYLKYTAWVTALVVVFIAFRSSLEHALSYVSIHFGISADRANIVAQTMVVVSSAMGLCYIVSRLAKALVEFRTWFEVTQFFKTRTALLSLAFCGLFGVIFSTRLHWWMIHMTTENGIVFHDFTHSANSILMSIMISIIVKAIYTRTSYVSLSVRCPGVRILLVGLALGLVAGVIYVE